MPTTGLMSWAFRRFSVLSPPFDFLLRSSFRLIHRGVSAVGVEMSGGPVLKRIPRIKFPERHVKSSGSQLRMASQAGDSDLTFFSSLKASPAIVAGKASLQPKRISLSNEEIEAILLGGCF